MDMPGYESYQRKWIVDQSTLPGCEPKDLVTFTVIVSCGGRPYAIGEYVPGTNTIARPNEFEIHLDEGPPRTITFTQLQGGQIAGSWTAEDQGPWPGDG